MARRAQKASVALEQRRQRMVEWRQSQTQRTRIPESFWLAAAGPVVELVDARGATLTIRFAPGAAADVGAVVQAFLGRRSS